MNSPKPKPKPRKPAKEAKEAKNGGRKRAPKDPNAPKKSLTAFMLFCRDRRPEIRAKDPNLKLPDVARECGRLWREISDSDKSQYQKIADEEKKSYEKAFKEYNNNKK